VEPLEVELDIMMQVVLEHTSKMVGAVEELLVEEVEVVVVVEEVVLELPTEEMVVVVVKEEVKVAMQLDQKKTVSCNTYRDKILNILMSI